MCAAMRVRSRPATANGFLVRFLASASPFEPGQQPIQHPDTALHLAAQTKAPRRKETER